MDKKSLSERDICTKFIAPALRKAGWDELLQIREEVSFTKGRIIVRGKLVAQDPNDEPASISLVERKRRRPQREVRSLDVPGRLVAPVASLLQFRYGKGKKASERLDEGPVPVFGSNGLVGYCETPLTEAPSIIVGRKGSAGALNLCDGPSWTTDVAYFVEAPHYFDLRYLLIGLQMLNLGSLGKGVKPGLSRADVYDLPLSVPPLPEQHRIVARVDELMALCDRLEKARADREATRDRLSASSLVRLDAPDPDPMVFRNHAAFALEHLTPLTTRRDQIKALRQTILNLAVRGKLMAQDPNDEPASISLVERKRRRPQREVRSLDVPGWLVAPVASLLQFRYGKGKKASERLDEGPVPVFGSNGLVGYCETPLTEAPSIIVGRKGSAGALNLCDGPSWTTDVAYFVEAPHYFDLRYLLIGLQMLNLGSLGKGVKPGLSRADVYDLPLSVPPLPEQHRIVARVDELMALCDRLETSLATADDTRCCLLGALLIEALEPGGSYASEQAERAAAHG